MKKIRIHSVWMLFLLSVFTCLQVKAQYMPVVFDKVYGDKNQIQLVCPLPGDEVAIVGKESQKYNLTWIEREGNVVFSLSLMGFTVVNEIVELDNNRVLVVGQSTMQYVKGKKGKIHCLLSGRSSLCSCRYLPQCPDELCRRDNRKELRNECYYSNCSRRNCHDWCGW